MSRQPRAGEPGQPLTIRVTRAEREHWQRAARAEGCSTLSAWVIQTLNKRLKSIAVEIEHANRTPR